MEKAFAELDLIEKQTPETKEPTEKDVENNPEDPKEVLMSFVQLVEEGVLADTIVALTFFHEELIGTDIEEVNAFIAKFIATCQRTRVRTVSGFMKHLLTK